jgi:dienelactone hydrolase
MEELEYETGFRALLVRGARDRPGVLVLHGGAGIGEHERAWATDLSRQGYTTMLPDLFGTPFRDRAHGIEIITGLVSSPDVLRSRLDAALHALMRAGTSDARRCGAVGFCFGGIAALELARSGADVRAVVAIHGGLHTRAPARKSEVRARILVCIGARDPHVPREHRVAWEDEMTSAEIDWHLVVHGAALHGYTERTTGRPGCAYNAAAAAATRAATFAFLETSFACADASQPA